MTFFIYLLISKSTQLNYYYIASPGTDMLWILASMINSSYTSIWDIKMDWGLLQTSSRHFLLRDDLVFYKWVKYLLCFSLYIYTKLILDTYVI